MLRSNKALALAFCLFTTAALGQSISPVPGSSGGGSPTGPAGGELAGTYPNPTLVNSAVIGKVLTGYVSGGGTVAATDSILQAIQKLNGNAAAGPVGTAGGSLKGTYPNPGLADINSIATSLAIGGATIGTNALAAVGPLASFGATTTAPGFYAYLNGDTVARATVGLDTSDNPRLGFGSGSAARDTFLMRDAANVLAQRNGTAAQVFRVYNTFTDASNYERAVMSWSGNVLTVGTEKAGTGATRNMAFIVGGGTAMTIFSNQVVMGGIPFLFGADNSNDIGASGANRPRTGYFGTSIVIGAGAIQTSPNAAVLQMGAADSASPLAQTLQTQSVSAGNGNTAAPDTTFRGSLSNGSGLSGRLIFTIGNSSAASGSQNTATTRFTIGPSGGQVPVTTVSALPTCNSTNEGSMYGASDLLTPAFLTTVTGGGAVHGPVYCNGTNWVAM